MHDVFIWTLSDSYKGITYFLLVNITTFLDSKYILSRIKPIMIQDVGDKVQVALNWQKKLYQASKPKTAESLGLRLKMWRLCVHRIIIMGTLKIHLCPLHTGQVLQLPGVSARMCCTLHFWGLHWQYLMWQVLRIRSPLIHNYCSAQAASLICS